MTIFIGLRSFQNCPVGANKTASNPPAQLASRRSSKALRPFLPPQARLATTRQALLLRSLHQHLTLSLQTRPSRFPPRRRLHLRSERNAIAHRVARTAHCLQAFQALHFRFEGLAQAIVAQVRFHSAVHVRREYENAGCSPVRLLTDDFAQMFPSRSQHSQRDWLSAQIGGSAFGRLQTHVRALLYAESIHIIAHRRSASESAQRLTVR